MPTMCLLFLFFVTLTLIDAQTPGPTPTEESGSKGRIAKASSSGSQRALFPQEKSPGELAKRGEGYLGYGWLESAQADCDAAYKADPSNASARNCMQDV